MEKNQKMASKSIKDYLEEIKKDKKVKHDRAQKKLDEYQVEFNELERTTTKLLNELFDLDNISYERATEITLELKKLSHERVRLAQAIFVWENKLNQLKFL